MMARLLKQSTAFTFRVGPFLDDTDFKTAETALAIGQADIQISKAGGAFAQTSAAPTTTHDTDGWYQCPLTATDTGTLGSLTVQIVVAGALPVWEHFEVVPELVFNSLVNGIDVLTVDVTKWNNASVETPSVVGVPKVDVTYWEGNGVSSTIAGVPNVDLFSIKGVAQSATVLKDFADSGYDPATNQVEGVKLVDTTTVNTDMRGTDNAALASVVTPAAISDAVWDEVMADHTTPGTTGRELDDSPQTALYFTGFASDGTASNQTYWDSGNSIPANKVLTGGESDNDSVHFTAEIHQLGIPWQHDSVILKKDGVAVVTKTNDTWTQLAQRHFQVVFDYTGATANSTFTIETSDGKGTSDSFAYVRSQDPPLILTAVIDNNPSSTGGNAKCPLAQTQVSASDVIYISGTAENHADEVYVKDYEVATGEGVQGPFAVVAGVWSGTINCGTGNNATANYKCYAKVTGGTAGADFISTDSVDLNQTVPTFSAVGHSYPAGQEAIKNTETDTVTITHTNAAAGDSYLYDDNSTGELTIPSTTAYSAAKAVQRLSGNYRETGTNYRLTVTRLAMNGLSATKTGTVKIAHTTPVLTVSMADADGGGGTAPTRMGSGSGTKDHVLYVNSTQANLSTYTPSLAMDAGDSSAWTGSWAVHDADTWKRSKRVLDADINAGGQAANNFTWGAASFKNRAGLEATAITTNTAYSLGGFTSRTLNMGPITGGDPPYTHTADIGVPVVDTAKTTVANQSKGGTPTQVYEGNVTEHNDADSSLNNYWTTVSALASETFNDYTQYFHCSDKKFYDGVTAPGGFNVTIAESEV